MMTCGHDRRRQGSFRDPYDALTPTPSNTLTVLIKIPNTVQIRITWNHNDTDNYKAKQLNLQQ